MIYKKKQKKNLCNYAILGADKSNNEWAISVRNAKGIALLFSSRYYSFSDNRDYVRARLFHSGHKLSHDEVQEIVSQFCNESEMSDSLGANHCNAF